MPEDDPLVLRREIRRLQEQNKELRQGYDAPGHRARLLLMDVAEMEGLSSDFQNRVKAFCDGLNAAKEGKPSAHATTPNFVREKLDKAVSKFIKDLKEDCPIVPSRNRHQNTALQILQCYLDDRQEAGEILDATYIGGVMEGLELAFACRFGRDYMFERLDRTIDQYPRPSWLPGNG